jgi:acyl-CoA synthetase (AMP-forming)/AMP-acid ligase II
VTAVVQLRPDLEDPPDPSELREHCRIHLAGYKLPRDVVYVDTLRRSPSGKPDYRWAKETALASLGPAATDG